MELIVDGTHRFKKLLRTRVSIFIICCHKEDRVILSEVYYLGSVLFFLSGYLLLVGGYPNHPIRIGQRLSIFDLLHDGLSSPYCFNDSRISQSSTIGGIVHSKPLMFAGPNNGGGLLEEILWTFHRGEFRSVCQDIPIYPSSLYFAVSLGDRLLVGIKGISKMIFVAPPDHPGFRCVM